MRTLRHGPVPARVALPELPVPRARVGYNVGAGPPLVVDGILATILRGVQGRHPVRGGTGKTGRRPTADDHGGRNRPGGAAVRPACPGNIPPRNRGDVPTGVRAGVRAQRGGGLGRLKTMAGAARETTVGAGTAPRPPAW